ncbi:hypothetical protein [Novipirellula maiorica]|nr:hypothetical protein [Rhodopirellula maiorica]
MSDCASWTRVGWITQMASAPDRPARRSSAQQRYTSVVMASETTRF